MPDDITPDPPVTDEDRAELADRIKRGMTYGAPRPPLGAEMLARSRKLNAIRFRAHHALISQADARFLLRLVDIGEKAIDRLDPTDPIVAEWVRSLL